MQSAVNDPIASIREDMSEFLSLFDDWAADIEQSLKQQHRTFDQSINESIEELESLKKLKSELIEKQSTQSINQSEKQVLIEQLKQHVAQLEDKAHIAPSINQNIQSKRDQLLKQLENNQQTINDQSNNLSNQLKHLQERMRPYEQALGLTIRSKQNVIEVVFASVDAADLAREFSLGVIVKEAQYVLQSVTPQETKQSISQLIKELNHDHNNFFLFLVHARKIFQQYVQDEIKQ